MNHSVVRPENEVESQSVTLFPTPFFPTPGIIWNYELYSLIRVLNAMKLLNARSRRSNRQTSSSQSSRVPVPRPSPLASSQEYTPHQFCPLARPVVDSGPSDLSPSQLTIFCLDRSSCKYHSPVQSQ